jgi:hypothetical protein
MTRHHRVGKAETTRALGARGNKFRISKLGRIDLVIRGWEMSHGIFNRTRLTSARGSYALEIRE